MSNMIAVVTKGIIAPENATVTIIQGDCFFEYNAKALGDTFVNSNNIIEYKCVARSTSDTFVSSDNVIEKPVPFNERMRGGSYWVAGTKSHEDWF